MANTSQMRTIVPLQPKAGTSAFSRLAGDQEEISTSIPPKPMVGRSQTCSADLSPLNSHISVNTALAASNWVAKGYRPCQLLSEGKKWSRARRHLRPDRDLVPIHRPEESSKNPCTRLCQSTLDRSSSNSRMQRAVTWHHTPLSRPSASRPIAQIVSCLRRSPHLRHPGASEA